MLHRGLVQWFFMPVACKLSCESCAASGDVVSGSLESKDVAVKIFKAETSPDGRAVDEIAVACFVEHPNCTKVVAFVENGLVFNRVYGSSMADKVA